MASLSALSIGVLLPELLGTYGDTGNALVLKRRAQWRGINATVVPVSMGKLIPDSLDIYVLGGGEDTAQNVAVEMMRRNHVMRRIVDSGKTVLAICAAFQILGQRYRDAAGHDVNGLGLLNCYTVPQAKRTIGELVTRPLIPGLDDLLTGFENHGGATYITDDGQGLGKVVSRTGIVSDERARSIDGMVHQGIFATYMHGPVLARNPQFADHLIERATGIKLEHHPLPEIDTLRTERLLAAGARGTF